MGNLVAGNIFRDLSNRDSEDREQYLANAEKHRNLAKQQLDELKQHGKSFDATYARFLILLETEDEGRLRELIDELESGDKDLNPYLYQLAGVSLFQLNDTAARSWIVATPGVQGNKCKFMEFFLEMCTPGFSPESSDLNEKVRRYIEQKIVNGDVSYLESDWCVAALLGDHDYAASLVKRIQPLQSPYPMYDDVYRYLRRDGLDNPQSLLQMWQHDNRMVCEVNFFLGIESLSLGHCEQAKVYFRQSLEADFFPFYLHWWSRAFLKHMERNPDWPRWLRRNESR